VFASAHCPEQKKKEKEMKWAKRLAFAVHASAADDHHVVRGRGRKRRKKRDRRPSRYGRKRGDVVEGPLNFLFTV